MANAIAPRRVFSDQTESTCTLPHYGLGSLRSEGIAQRILSFDARGQNARYPPSLAQHDGVRFADS